MTTRTIIALAFAGACAAATAPERQPNIIMLLADDLGGGDLHCTGHPYARTPAIDSLARDGTRFVQAYAAGATCCPARTGLMTSRYPATYPVYPANGGFADRTTVTAELKRIGYATGHVGKWHLGPDKAPGTYGIDLIAGADEGESGGRRRHGDERGRDAPVYDAAIRFIEQHRDGPFYLNVWGHTSHNPVNPGPALVARWDGLAFAEADFPAQMLAKFGNARAAGADPADAMRRYLADVESLDDSVGRLLARLDELGLRERTIVVFSSDQGASMEKTGAGGTRANLMGCNGPLRGGKHTHWEGGVRVPWIVRWPGHVPAGRVDSQSVIAGVDWMPTVCAIAGIPAPAGIEGEDVSGAWLGQAAHVRARPLFWKTSSPGSEALMRDGPWKLRLPTRRRDGEAELYDITADPAESRNVAAEHTEVLAAMSTTLSAWVGGLPKTYQKADDGED